MDNQLIFGVSDFVAYLNQTLEIAYPYITIEGELSNFRVSKNRWVYFDLKDEASSVKFFGTVYSLPGPLEEGMIVRVSGSPRLHNLYGFSVNFQAITPVGEGAAPGGQSAGSKTGGRGIVCAGTQAAGTVSAGADRTGDGW